MATLQTGRLVEVNAQIALDASRFDLPLADSVIYATAQQEGALLWTQDEDFQSLPGVKYFKKK